MTQPTLAFDDSSELAADKSMRSVDADGHMKVTESRISKANVCPYLGREIPDFQALQLDPDKIYHLYRDPIELAKAASTFDGKPLLIKHVGISADLPNQSLWVGTLGQTTFEAPYLITRPLTVLTAEAIKLIESKAQRELSAGYRYRADMTPGVTNTGERFDGRMADICGNHVAIVSEGRAGHDVHVADNLPPELKRMKFPNLTKALTAAAGDPAKIEAALLAFDAAGLGEVEAKSVISLDESEKAEAEREALEAKKKTDGKDAALTDEEKADCYDKAKDKKAKDAKRGKDEQEVMDKKARDKKAKDALPDDKDHRRDFGGPAGKDQALTMDQVNAEIDRRVRIASDAAVKLAVDATTARLTALGEARSKVRPLVGEVSMALDSAADVYRFALKHVGIDAKEIHESALPALVDMAASRKASEPTNKSMALDSSQAAMLDLDAMFAAPVQH